VYSDDPQDDQLMFRTGLQFLAIREGDRARIIRYLHKAQMKGLAHQLIRHPAGRGNQSSVQEDNAR
jgi:hypothetical protein